MEATPRFLRGAHPFRGSGYDKPTPVDAGLTYVVPSDKRAQLIYLRAGNSCSELIYLVLLRDGKTMRYFPIGAKASERVSAYRRRRRPFARYQTRSAARHSRGNRRILRVGYQNLRNLMAPCKALPGQEQHHARVETRCGWESYGGGQRGRGSARPRRGRPNLNIVMFGEEPYGNYNRILLSNILSGAQDAGTISSVTPLASGTVQTASHTACWHPG